MDNVKDNGRYRKRLRDDSNTTQRYSCTEPDEAEEDVSPEGDDEFCAIVLPPLLPNLNDVDESNALFHSATDWQEIYTVIDIVVGDVGGPIFDHERMTLNCTMNIATSQEKLEQMQLFATNSNEESPHEDRAYWQLTDQVDD